jgi:TatD DNase family protein
VTFKNARKSHEVAEKVPVTHLLAETDGPYLAPEPHRGKRNEPGYTRLVVERIAEIKGLETEEVAEATYLNAARLLGD